MSQENSLFDNQQPKEISGEDALKLLVGEEGKYSSVEELAKAMVHSQNHIQQLESENHTFKEQVQKQASIDEVLAAIQQQQAQPPASENVPPQDPSGDTPPKSEPVDIDSRIEEYLNSRDAQSRAKANRAKVLDSLAQQLGEAASERYKATAQRLGVNLDKLAEESPDAVINLVVGSQTPRPDHQVKQTRSQGSSLGRRTPAHAASNPMSYKAIQEQFAKGAITRAQKHTLETEGLLNLGSDEFWK